MVHPGEGRGVDLTPVGQRLFAEARALLAHAQDFQTAARGEGEALAGPLELGCFVTLAPFFLPALLAGFGQANPGIQARPHEGDHASLCRGLVAGGHGYSLLNLAPAHDRTYDGGRVVARPLNDSVPPLRIVVARAAQARATRRARAFTSHAKAFFGGKAL